VLFFGSHGTGPYCYGTGAECSDPINADLGNHAYPYVSQIWAYDVDDLIAVAEGDVEPWQPRPAVWTMEAPLAFTPDWLGTAYDPATQRIFVVLGYGSPGPVPIVQVYRIRVPACD
jgi:hypothetical protein